MSRILQHKRTLESLSYFEVSQHSSDLTVSFSFQIRSTEKPSKSSGQIFIVSDLFDVSFFLLSSFIELVSQRIECVVFISACAHIKHLLSASSYAAQRYTNFTGISSRAVSVIMTMFILNVYHCLIVGATGCSHFYWLKFQLNYLIQQLWGFTTTVSISMMFRKTFMEKVVQLQAELKDKALESKFSPSILIIQSQKKRMKTMLS